MAVNCQDIEPMLMPYINRQLSDEDNGIVIRHIIECKECRREAAELIRLKKMMLDSMTEVPEDIFHSAFDKIEEDGRFITPSEVMSILYDYLSTIKKSIKFAFSVI